MAINTCTGMEVEEFTYGTWFALKGLAAAGKTYYNCPAMRNGVNSLLATQWDDGGWGESYLSCLRKVNSLSMNQEGLLNLCKSFIVIYKPFMLNCPS